MSVYPTVSNQQMSVLDQAVTILQGLQANIPGTNTVAYGTLYLANDTGNLFQSNGSSWIQVPLAPTTDATVAAANKDGATNKPSMRTLGSGAQQACAGNDSRLSNSRSPSGAAGGILNGSYPNPGMSPSAAFTIQQLTVSGTTFATGGFQAGNSTVTNLTVQGRVSSANFNYGTGSVTINSGNRGGSTAVPHGLFAAPTAMVFNGILNGSQNWLKGAAPILYANSTFRPQPDGTYFDVTAYLPEGGDTASGNLTINFTWMAGA